MEFFVIIKYKNEERTWEEGFDSDNLYLNVGARATKQVPFPIESETEEEFERFGKALVENYNKYVPPKLERECVGVRIS